MKITVMKDLAISGLVLGTVQLGMPYGIANKSGMPDVNTGLEIIQEAINGGVNTLDTASAYGESEKIIGLYNKSKKDSERPLVVTKVAKSVELIKDPKISIAQAASETGFDDHTYFSRLFKQVFGMSPSEFRKHSFPE
jgi:aryl-alcohol dehydrogenase-like predicted oxidoreductase